MVPATMAAVLDLVGGPGFPPLPDVLRRDGCLVIAGASARPLAHIDLRALYLKDLTHCGAILQEDAVFPCLWDGRIRPVGARTYPLAQIVQAQKDFLARTHVGKLVLIPPQETP